MRILPHWQRVEQRAQPAEHDRVVVEEYDADRAHLLIVLPRAAFDPGSCTYPTRESSLTMGNVRRSRPVSAQRLWKYHHPPRSF
jgi:hypothetical protein